MNKIFNYEDEFLTELKKITLPSILVEQLEFEAKRLNVTFNEALYLYCDKGINVVDEVDFENYNIDQKISRLKIDEN